MDPIIGAALIGAGSSALGNIFGKKSTDDTNKTNLEINKMNNEFNEKMLDKQLAYNTDMWNKTNEYNSASSQVQRYRDAGLNPYLMMTGGANAGTASNVSGGTASSSSPAQMQSWSPDMSGFNQAAQMLFEKRKQEADIANINADTTAKNIENITRLDKQYIELAILKKNSKNWDLKNVFDDLQNQTKSFQVGTMYDQYYRDIREQELRMNNLRLDAIKKELENTKLPEILQANVANVLADTAYKKKVTEHEAEKIIKTQAERLGVQINYEIIKNAAQYIVQKHVVDSYPTGPYPHAVMNNYSPNWHSFSPINYPIYPEGYPINKK